MAWNRGRSIENKHTHVAYGQVIPTTGGLVASSLLVAYLIAKPFYFFPSGGPQVADGIACLLFVVTFLGRQTITRATSPVLWACILFATYTLIVNAIWAMILMDLSMLMSPAFYFFNTMVVYVILTLNSRTEGGVLKVMLVGIVASIGVQALLTVWSAEAEAERQILFFFDNPNRLGYWALLSATMFCIIAKQMKMRMLVQVLFLLLAFYLIAISLSKAAIVALFLLLAIHFSRSIGQLLVVSVIGVIALYFLSHLTLFEDVVARLNNIGGQSDDSLQGRGYDRLWLYPQYLLFGAGEQGLERFPETDIELHSTLGAVLFGYGVVGAGLFGLLLWRLFRLAGWWDFLYLAPAFAYGLAHQGLRFTLFWTLFALIAISGASAVSRSAKSSRAPAGMNDHRQGIQDMS
jgi:hypothetical protein